MRATYQVYRSGDLWIGGLGESCYNALMDISVIIPTHNRAKVLKRCLENLDAQKGVSFEVIVVDDGSNDETEEVVKSFEKVFYLKQKKSQQGVARNRGMEAARGEIVVFIGDDIWVEEDFLQRHLKRHREFAEENVAVLGFTTWSEELKINDYMRFLEESGWQFGYGFLEQGFVEQTEPYKFFYTSNISLKRSFLRKESFNENFREYGWEDIELGYRLWKSHGLRLFYEPMARAAHYHFLGEEDLVKKMRSVGASAREFESLHPEMRVAPSGIKKWVVKFLAANWVLRLARMTSGNFYFKLKSWKEFFKGYDGSAKGN